MRVIDTTPPVIPVGLCPALDHAAEALREALFAVTMAEAQNRLTTEAVDLCRLAARAFDAADADMRVVSGVYLARCITAGIPEMRAAMVLQERDRNAARDRWTELEHVARRDPTREVDAKAAEREFTVRQSILDASWQSLRDALESVHATVLAAHEDEVRAYVVAMRKYTTLLNSAVRPLARAA